MTSVSCCLRPAQSGDVDALADVFRRTIRKLGPQQYSVEQVAEWASAAERPQFRDFILCVDTFVSETNGRIGGFCGIADNGYIASLYVDPDFLRQRVASQLLDHAIQHVYRSGVQHLRTEASRFSRPLFRKFGFVDVGTEPACINGVYFDRYLMRRLPSDVLPESQAVNT